MKKLLLLGVLVLFLIGTVSAFEIDNKLTYSNEDLKVTFENLWGLPLIGSELGTAELKSHPSVNYVKRVGAGNQVTMWYDFDFVDLYENGFGEVIFTDQRTGEIIERDYSFVYWGDKERDVFRQGECSFSINETKTCENIFLGKEIYKTWLPYNSKDIPKGSIRIGIKVNVKINDYVDGVWVVVGKGISKHAEWTADLNVDLVSYWMLDEVSGTLALDSIDGVYNGTLIDMTDSNWISGGLIGNALDFFNNSNRVLIPSFNDGNSDSSISLWLNYTPDDIRKNGNFQNSAILLGDWSSGFYFIDNSTHLLFRGWNGDATASTIGEVLYANWDETIFNHLVFIYSDVGSGTLDIELYLNNVSFGEITDVGSAYGDYEWIGGHDVNALGLNGTLDEIGLWNRSLTVDEISDLYNNGNGIGFLSLLAPSVTLNSPENGLNTTNNTILFNATIFDDNNLVNVSLYIDDVLNETNSSGINNTDYLFIKTFDVGSYNWTYKACDINNSCTITSTRTFNIFSFIEESQTFNVSSFETATESFNVNLTTNGSIPTIGKLIYGSVIYSDATITNTVDNNYNISRTIQIPIGIGTINWSFNFTLAGSEMNTSIQNQLVNSSELGLCNATLIVPYINFTFKDEADSSLINATIDSSTWEYWLGGGSITKSLLYSNTTENNDYAFCFNGGNRTLHNTRSIQYASTGYPQRKYDAISDLTNTVTNKILWLLSSTDGIYSSIQVVDSKGNRISGVGVTAERQFSGIWTIIGQEVTDDAGSVTFWLNPDYDHRFTFTSDDCIGASVTIRPTQSQYTQQLQCDGTGEDFISQLEGLKYSRTPIEGIIQAGITNFTYFVTSSKYTITNASFQIVNSSNSVVLNYTELACSSDECLLYFTYDVPIGADIKGRYYVDFGNGSILLEGDARWVNVVIDTTGKAGLSTLWNDLRYVLDDWGEGSNTGDFNRLVVIFFFMCLGIAFFNYHFGIDTQNPGAFMFILTMVILSGSLVGGLDGQGFFYYNNLSSVQFINNYILAFFMIIISVSYFIQVNTQAKR